MTSFFARPWRPPKSTPPPSAPRQGSASGSNDHSRPDYPWFVPHLKVDEPMRLPTGPAMWRRPTAMNMTGPLLPRYGHSVPLVSTPSGDIYVFGGRVKGEVKDDLWMIRGVWEPDAAVGQDGRRSTKEMSVVASLVETTGDAPGPRVGHKSALVSTALIVWGGHTLPKEGERHDDGLYLLNLTTHEWIKVGVTGPAPLGRWGHAVGVCGNKFIVFGGRVDGEFFNDLWGFDLRSLVRGRVTWEQLTPDPGNELPPPRTGHVLVTYKNKIYIFGGTDGACHYNDTWCFNISTRTWSELTCIGSIPIPREGHAATLVGDVMYIFGGRAFNGRGLGDMASFKISNKRWYILQNMGPQPSERSGHATAVADGRMFVIGGEGDEWSPTLHDVMTLHVFDTSKPTLSFLAPNQPCADLIKYPERKRHQREKSNAATSPPLQQPPAPQPGLAPSGEGQSSSSTDLQEEARKRKNATTRKAQEAIARKEHEKTLAQKAQGEAAGKLQERTQSRTHEEPARGAQEETQRQEDPSRTPDGEWTKLSPASDEESAYESASEERGMSDARENESAIPDITTLGLSEMTTPQMLRCLVDYGCIDLTSAINPEKTSLGMVVGGSFGDIWSGQLRDNTSIAIKVWRFTSLTQDRGKSLKRAMREICYWSELNHPHIHKLLGVTVFQGRLGMVSEWMANGNLREYIQKNPSTKRHPLCVQVTSGVEYLHHRGTVHGDIKACNFLVSQDRVVKLTDFDHSIMMDCSIRFTETSRVGGGTLRWMAPELVIIEPTHQRNKRTDVYALGMTLLEVITGRVPYELECQSDTTVVMKLLNKVMPRRTEHFKANRWGNGMWNLLVRCWDHDPNIRPSAEDANVLVLDLSPPA